MAMSTLSHGATMRMQEPERGDNYNPINGMHLVVLVAFRPALLCAAERDEELAAALSEVLQHLEFADMWLDNFQAHPPPLPAGLLVEPLNREEMLIIHMYTHDCVFFRIVNARLRSEKRDVLEPFKPLLKLLLTAIYKLPRISGTLYRGVRVNLCEQNKSAQVKVWWAVTSCTTSMDVLKNSAFSGYDGQRTMFVIQACAAFDVSRYASLPESEVILAPGTKLKVTGSYSPTLEVHNIALIQEPFVELPGINGAGGSPLSAMDQLRLQLSGGGAGAGAGRAAASAVHVAPHADASKAAELAAANASKAAELVAAQAAARAAEEKARAAQAENEHLKQQANAAKEEARKAAELAAAQAAARAAEEKARAVQAENEHLKQQAAAARAAEEKARAAQAENERLKQQAAAAKETARKAAELAAAQAAARDAENKARAVTPWHPQITAPGMVPLSSLARPRPLALPPLRSYPIEVCELPDQSLIVADGGHRGGGPAWRVWPDGSRDPQQLPPATANATCVLPVEGGHLVVSYYPGRVERTGSTAWKRTDLNWPWAAVVVGDTVLVTETGGGRVVRLALGSGATVGTVGDGILQQPRGIAVAVTGEIVVSDCGTKLVHVFDGTSFAQLRTLGAGLLKNPIGVCVDGGARVYLCDCHSSVKAVVVLDGASGARLATIAVPGMPWGVRVTRTGAIVVTHHHPNGAVVISPS